MKFKSLLIAAVGVATATGAQAADLPPAPEPVDYVRVCDAFGSGFFYIPGTDSCLRLRGRLRVETRYRNQAEGQALGIQARGGLRSNSPFFMRARGYWGWDHRTNTDIGLVRAFFRGNLTKNTGNGTATAVSLDYAFIQIGGLTLGYADMVIEPVFGGYTDEHSVATGGFEQEDVIAQYVYSFGNGFSAGIVVFDQTTSDFQNTGSVAVPGVAGAGFGGNRMPAGGAAITYDGSIGTFRLAGVVRDIRPAAAFSHDHDMGWGIGFSGEIGVPIGTNTSIGFNAQYADGVVEWLHEDIGGYAPDYNIQTAARGGVVPSTSTGTTKGWSITGGLTTQIMDKTTFNLSGGYTDANIKWADDVAMWDVQANLEYQLTSNLVLTAGAAWQQVSTSTLRDSDAFSTILRAQLDF